MTEKIDFKFPKVLIAAPQHDSKKYCWEEWKERVNSLTYPNYEVFLADNSLDDTFSKEIKADGFSYDIVERLLTNKKMVVAATYDIFHGKQRKSMIQVSEPLDRTYRAYRTVPFIEHEEPLFFDGTTKQVYHAGLGCVLISKYVFDKIPFRHVKGSINHADTWFANDCFYKDIPIFADTSIHCKHLNGTWLDQADEILEPILENKKWKKIIT
mgnify:CR=1 FL=1